MNLPAEFENRMKLLLGEDFQDFVLSFDAPAAKAVQLHPQTASMSEILNSAPFLKPVPHLENACYCYTDKIGQHPYHHAGIFYSQDPAAMLPAGACPLSPDARVLDLCAAPGGKSSQLASVLETGGGCLISNEINPQRNKILVGNIERMGFTNVLVTRLSAEELGNYYPGYFDLVLVDAPCSGEGMFRKYEESILEWSLSNIDTCARRQREMLAHAVTCLKPGGRLIYSTCTYAPEEDEAIVDYLVSEQNLSLVPLKNEIGRSLAHLSPEQFTGAFCETFHLREIPEETLSGCYRFYPHKGYGEGQFFACLKKGSVSASAAPARGKPLPLKPASPDQIRLFLDALDGQLKELVPYLYEFENKLLIIPEHYPDLPPRGITKCGVTAGELLKNRFQPHHDLFRAYGRLFDHKISLPASDPRLWQYLNGQEVSFQDIPNGYGVLCVQGVPVGGFKAVGGRCKNHYPKGLRNSSASPSFP